MTSPARPLEQMSTWGSRTPTRPRAAPASPARQGPIRVLRPPTTARSIPHPVFIWSETIAAVMSRVSVSAARQAAAAAAVTLPGTMARLTGTERRLSDWISPTCSRPTAISRSTRTLRRTGSCWEFLRATQRSLGTKIADITSAQNNAGITPTGDFLYFVSDSGWGSANVLLHSLTVTPDAVPEPASLALLATALFGAGFLRRQQRPVLVR